MSTRCNIRFCEPDGTVQANIYQHCDGYPDSEHGVMATMEKFFSDVEKSSKDTRFDDPTFLAARFVYWDIKSISGDTNPLGTVGIGVYPCDADDSEYLYDVICRRRDTRPEVLISDKPHTSG